MPRRILFATIALTLGLPMAALAQVTDEPIIEPPLPPCPWWDCGGTAEVVVESYRVDTIIEDGIATTHVTQVLRNDSAFIAQGQFLFPIPADAVVTGLTLWIDGSPVSGEVLDGDTARRTYEDIVRRTLDPALLEFADDGLVRLSVFPMPARATRTVEIEYREVLPADGGLVRYTNPLAREHEGTVEQVSARIEIRTRTPLKSVLSPTHAVSVSRPDEHTAVVGYEGSGRSEDQLVLYYATDSGPMSLDVVTYRADGEGYFLLFASPGLAPNDAVIAKDVVVVVDVSGSMEGEKLAQAQEAARYVLGHLNVGDRFDVIAFSTVTTSYGDGLRPGTEATAAADWVGRLSAGGATDIDRALSEAFTRGDAERPLYVMFLTDGLPTEGVTDTAAILDHLEQRTPPASSVFAFGVGYDVDTFLLDSIARDHHGTTTYVTPAESVDGAVEALYAKVSSPVLTDVTLAVSGVIVSDLYPHPFPDVFSGGQVVLAGRYDVPGTATVTLSGNVGTEPTTLSFDDVAFGDTGGDDSVPRLWATRKIGDLLRTIRLDGPNDETIDQIVRLSIRWGVVTPYTSYLVTEDAPFGAEAIDDISRSAASAATSTIAPTTGAEAFDAADAASAMASADVSSVPAGAYGDVVRLAGGKTFRLSEGVWIDTTFDPASMTPLDVPFGSDDYFALAAAAPSVAGALSVSPSLIVVHDGVAYRIVGPSDSGDPLPVPADGDEATTTTVVVVAAAPAQLPAEPRSDLATAAVAIAAAIGVAAALAWAALKRS